MKSDLARRIVAELHSPAAADEAAAEFDRVHSRGELPSDLRDVSVEFGSDAARPLARVLVEVGLAASASDAGRRIQQGGVRVNGARVTDVRARLSPGDLPVVLQSGRRAVRLVSST